MATFCFRRSKDCFRSSSGSADPSKWDTSQEMVSLDSSMVMMTGREPITMPTIPSERVCAVLPRCSSRKRTRSLGVWMFLFMVILLGIGFLPSRRELGTHCFWFHVHTRGSQDLPSQTPQDLLPEKVPGWVLPDWSAYLLQEHIHRPLQARDNWYHLQPDADGIRHHTRQVVSWCR